MIKLPGLYRKQSITQKEKIHNLTYRISLSLLGAILLGSGIR